MQLLLLRFLTRLMALLAIVGGFFLGISSITPGEGTYAVLLILVGTVVGWRGALWATNREVKETGKEPANPPGWPLSQEELQRQDREALAQAVKNAKRGRGGKHRK